MAQANSVYDPEADQEPVPRRLPESETGRPANQTAPLGDPSDPRGDFDPQRTPLGDASDPRDDSSGSRNGSNDTRGDLRRAEQGGEQDSGGGGGEGGGLYNAGGDSSERSVSPGGLAAAEGAGWQTSAVNSHMTGGIAGVGGISSTGLKNFFWGTSRRRRSTISGGIIGLLVGGGIFGMSIVSGPLEFIHLAQVLEKFHFSKQEDAENNRLEKIVRYLNDPERPERTRIGIVGNAIADTLEAKIHDATGLSPKYEKGSFKGYVADPEHDSYKGQSLDEMKATMANQLGVDVSSIGTTTTKGGIEVPIYNPDTGGINTVKNYRNQISTARALFTEAGFNDISAHVSARVLKTRAGWTFHPIKKLDSAVQQQLLKGGKAALDKLKEQFNTQEEEFVAGDTSKPPALGESSSEQDSNGNPVNDPNRTAATSASSDIEANPSEANIKAKLTGGGALLVGALCVMNGLNKEVPKLREAKVMLPMERLAGQFMSLGSQAMSGQDIDMTQLGFYKEFLDGTNSQGQVTSTWAGARSIEAESGEPQDGPDLPQGAQVFNAGVPFPFINDIPVLGTACGILGSPIGILGSGVIAPVSTLFQQFVIGPHVLDPLVSDAAGWLSGVPINIFKGAGAVDGNYINYGARLSANQQFASAGGVQLSSSQEATLADTTNSLDNSEFQSKSIAYRIFNPDDDQTLASKIIDSYGAQSATQGFASLITGFGNIFTSSIKSIASLFTGIAHTSAAPPYDYHGLKAMGFSMNDLANTAYDNPFANACDVTGGQGCPNATGILGDPNSPNQSYISRVQTCFGDTILPDGGNWDISFTSNQNVDTESDSYKSANCAGTNQDWTRVRFWIMDTQTIEGYDCYTGGTSTSDQSCQDLGDSDSGSSSTPTTSTTTSTTSGNAQQLAQQILNNKNIDLTCLSSSVQQDVQDAAAGKPGTAGATTSTGILQLIATVGQNHNVCVTAIQSDGQGHCNGESESECPNDPHYTGHAVDFGSLDGVSITGRNAPALTIMKIAESTLSAGAFGQSQCGTTPTLPSGWTDFEDTCNHLHVQDIAAGS